MNQDTATLILEELQCMRADISSMNNRMENMENRMENIENDITAMNVRVNNIETTIAANNLDEVNAKLDNINDKLDANIHNTKVNSLNVDYIKGKVDLGEYHKKSFWTDNWYCSSLAVPTIQLISSYIFTFANPPDASSYKKNE